MSYKKAKNLLPAELVELIQNYVDGEYIYIPRREDNKKSWGFNTATKSELGLRNTTIYNDYQSGMAIATLVEKYYLSSKSIERIVLKEKRKQMNI
ncbi:MAG: CD3324 family protein [Solibacillus sp.]